MMSHKPRSRRNPTLLPALAWLVWGLSGCADGGSSYPSLASRPAERLIDSASPSAPNSPETMQAPGVPSADLVARLDRLVEQARSAHRDFADHRASAEQQVAAAGAAPVGSEQWARGTQALSGIEAARSLTAQPLADFDRLEIDDRLAHPVPAGNDPAPPRPDANAIAQARDTVAALVAEEDQLLAKLDGRLAR